MAAENGKKYELNINGTYTSSDLPVDEVSDDLPF